jgi:hypothetical protein
VCRWGQLAVLDQLVVVSLGVVDDPQDPDEAKGAGRYRRRVGSAKPKARAGTVAA